jgi:hypothetical protein
MKKAFLALLVVLLSALPSLAANGHYVAGVEGVKVASVPGPGYYLLNYLAAYNADRVNDGDGHKAPINFDLDVVCDAIRPLWVTDYKVFGADYAMFATIPLTYTHVQYSNYGGDTRSSIGDVDVCPLLLSWHLNRWDIAFGYEIFLPVGDYNKARPASPGKNYWTHMFDIGGTYFFDEDRTWSLSALLRYEINTENRATDVRYGDNLIVEAGLGKMIGMWEFGLAGYWQKQMTDDSGSGVTWDKDVHDSSLALGPVISYIIAPWKTRATFRFLHEVQAKDAPEGNLAVFTLAKEF